MKKEILGYIAGILDARGSILMHKTPLEEFKRPCIRLVVPKNRIKIAETIKEEFGGCVCLGDNGRYQYVVYGKRVVKMLTEIQPLIKSPVKIAQIALIIDAFPRLNFTHTGPIPRSVSLGYDNKCKARRKFEARWSKLFDSVSKTHSFTMSDAKKILSRLAL